MKQIDLSETLKSYLVISLQILMKVKERFQSQFHAFTCNKKMMH